MKIYKVVLLVSASIALFSGCVSQNSATPKAAGYNGETSVIDQISHPK